MEINYKTFKIYSDSNEKQYILAEPKVIKKGKTAGEINENVIGYYAKMEVLINRIIEIELMRSEDVVTLKEFVERKRELVEEINSLFK